MPETRANTRHWEYGPTQLADAEEHQKALAKAEGLPRESRAVTPGVRHPNPDRPDGKWMSTQVVDIDELAGPPREYAVQRAEAVQRHEGKRVRVDGKQVVIPDSTTAVNREARWDESVPRKVRAAEPSPGPKVRP